MILKTEEKIQKKIEKLVNKLDKKLDICYNNISWIVANSKNIRDFDRQLQEMIIELQDWYKSELYTLLLATFSIFGADEDDFTVPMWENGTFETRLNDTFKQISNDLTKTYKLSNYIDNTQVRLDKNRKRLRANLKRLTITENDKVLNDSYLTKIKKDGYKKYKIQAIIDNRTSDICREMNQREFFIKDYETGVTAPPFHPNCRSVIEEVEK